MKKITPVLITAAMLPFMIACNSGDESVKTEDSAAHDHHTMANTADYFMELATNPATIEPGKEVTLSLTPKNRSAASEQVALETENEKKIHLIVVSDDLSWFEHLHPEYQPDGSYLVKAKFPAAGRYKAFADYKPSGGSQQVDKLEIEVAGTPKAPVRFSGDKLSGKSGNYSFTIEPTGGKLITGVLLHLSGIVKKDGKEIDANTLDNYLGSKAHFVLISLNEKEYLHVHPTVSGGQFDLHTTFEKPGIYRGWVQFNAEGQLHTIDFTMNVAQGSDEDIRKANQSHTEKHTGSHQH
ncbi:MAG TPA: hypothetical protein VF145_06475 [Chitinophagaceae bacterium]